MGLAAQRLRTRAWRGFAVAAAIGALVIWYIHVGRPWLVELELSKHIAEVALSTIKGVVAFLALVLFVGDGLLARLKRPATLLSRKLIPISLAGLGAVSVGLFLASDDVGPLYYAHHWELFHYYLGSKYHHELGYKRIYVCAAVAQAELGPEQEAKVRARTLRDLRDDTMTQASSALEDPGACKSHFTPERWKQYRRDIAFFVNNSAQAYWEQWQNDHGYNPPPVWTTVANLFSSNFPANRWTMRFLASIDLALYTAIFYLIWWAFGSRALIAGLVFLGAQYPGNGYFTGGAFLRQDWLFWLVASVCFARKRRYALAGGALTFSAMLRLFPIVFFGGWVVVIAARWIRTRRLAPEHLRLIAGCAVTAIVLAGWSTLLTGPHGWVDFYHHIRLHASTPLSNNMGLPQLAMFARGTAAAYGQGSDPWSLFLRHFEWFRWGMTGLVALLFVWVAQRQPLWRAGALGVLPVMLAAPITCYYYVFFLVTTALVRHSRAAGYLVVLCGTLSALSLSLGGKSFGASNDLGLRYLAQSVIFLSVSLGLVLCFVPWRRLRRASIPVEAEATASVGRLASG
jgi:hypothetical protein